MTFNSVRDYPTKNISALVALALSVTVLLMLQGCKVSSLNSELERASTVRQTSAPTETSESEFTEVSSPYSFQDQDDLVSSRRFVRNGIFLDKIQISAALFDFDSHKVDVRANKMLGSIAEKYHAELVNNYVYIVGHTDSDGPELYNSGLSARRAWGVVNALSKYNIPTGKMYVLPAGEHQPLVPNNSKKNKAMNRRVEVYISPDRDQALDWLRASACPKQEDCSFMRISILGVNEDYELSNNLRDPNIPSSVIPMRKDYQNRKLSGGDSVRDLAGIQIEIRDMDTVMIVRSLRQLGAEYGVAIDDKRRNNLITTLRGAKGKETK